MKKLFTIVAVAMMAVGANAQKISWGDSDVADKGKLDGKTYTNGSVTLTVTDKKASKFAIDLNSCRFGTADNYEKFAARLKTGGKSDSNLGLTLSVPADGTLKVCVRTGSNTDKTRTVVFTQNGTLLYSHTLDEAEAIKVDEEGEQAPVSVYPVYSFSVSAGNIDITFPVNSVNFYSFEFVTENGISTVLTPEVKENAPVYNLAGQKVSNDYKGVCIQNGKKFINK